MIEFLLGFIIGLLFPKGAGKWFCGCLVVIFGGGFALVALIFALAAEDQAAIYRLIVGVAGIALGLISIAIIRGIVR
mgnify:FL=1